MTRREVIAGLAATAVIGASDAALKKANIGGRLMQTTGQGDEDAMWKELFFNLTEDTWPESVVIPEEVTLINHMYWLCSSKVKEITFLGDVRFTANNTVAYGSSNLKTIRLPNTTALGSPSPTMNGMCENLHVPKLKQINDANNTFTTNASKLDVYIDESTCAEIKAFNKFPGTNNAAMKSKLTFHGSDGTLHYDGTEWIFTAS